MQLRYHVFFLCAILSAACSGNSPVAPKNPTPASTSSEARHPFSPSDGVGFCHWTQLGVSCTVQAFTSTGASILVTNGGSQTVAVNFTVFERFAPDTFASQQFYADGSTRVASLAPGGSTTLSVTFPSCAWQGDVYLGQELTTAPYPPETLFLGYHFGGGDLCLNEGGQGEEDEEIGVEGCTPGYWKNHENSWVPTGYAPSQALNTVCTIPAFLGASFANASMMDALNFHGGPGVAGAARILMRAAVAALLNAAHPDVDYPRTSADIIAAVNAALASNNRATMLTLASQLDGDNNLVCSISQ